MLVEVVTEVIVTVPYSIYNHLYSSAVRFSDPVSIAQNQLISGITRIIFHGNFVVSSLCYDYLIQNNITIF